MKKIKLFLKGIGRHKSVKYIVVCVLGVLVVGFLDENSILAHMNNKQRIAELEAETAVYQAAYERDQAKVQQLQHDPKAIEKIARERYFMKMADEDIFVLSDDETANTAYETAQ